MNGAVVRVFPCADVHAVRVADQSGGLDLVLRRPVGRAVSVGSALCFRLKARAADYRGRQAEQRAAARADPESGQDLANPRVGDAVEAEFPNQAIPRRVDVRQERRAERVLEAELDRHVFRRDPKRQERQDYTRAQGSQPPVQRILLNVCAARYRLTRHGRIVRIERLRSVEGASDNETSKKIAGPGRSGAGNWVWRQRLWSICGWTGPPATGLLAAGAAGSGPSAGRPTIRGRCPRRR